MYIIDIGLIYINKDSDMQQNYVQLKIQQVLIELYINKFTV